MLSDRILGRDQLIRGMCSVLGSGIVLGLVYVGTHGGKSGGSLVATLAVAAYAAGSAAAAPRHAARPGRSRRQAAS